MNRPGILSPTHPWPSGRAKPVRMVVLDVDGVLTDGGIYLDDNGLESKRFDVRDGMGIRLLRQAGLSVGVVTARRSRSVAKRAEELALTFVHQGVQDKWSCLQQELRRAGIEPYQCAYMGDDLVDLGVLQRVGLATAPLDAVGEVRHRVHWVATHHGGRGAVRELAENLLHTQARWQAVIAPFVDPVVHAGADRPGGDAVQEGRA